MEQHAKSTPIDHRIRKSKSYVHDTSLGDSAPEFELRTMLANHLSVHERCKCPDNSGSCDWCQIYYGDIWFIEQRLIAKAGKES